MRGKAEFGIIGLVGGVKTVGTTRKISVASSFPYRDDDGEWHDHTEWNTVTVFEDRVITWIDENLTKGDLVSVDGQMGENQYENANGDTVYSVEFKARQVNRLATKAQLDSTRTKEEGRNQAA